MNTANRDASPERVPVAKRRLKGLYGTAFLCTAPATRTMHQLLAFFGGHPRLQSIIIGIEPYPTNPDRHHYHFVLQYGTRVHLAFSHVAEGCGASADVRYLADTAAVMAACVYAVKNSHGLFYPPSKEAFVRRATPKDIAVDAWTPEQMETLGGFDGINGVTYLEHCQFFPVNQSSQ